MIWEINTLYHFPTQLEVCHFVKLEDIQDQRSPQFSLTHEARAQETPLSENILQLPVGNFHHQQTSMVGLHKITVSAKKKDGKKVLKLSGKPTKIPIFFICWWFYCQIGEKITNFNFSWGLKTSLGHIMSLRHLVSNPFKWLFLSLQYLIKNFIYLILPSQR